MIQECKRVVHYIWTDVRTVLTILLLMFVQIIKLILFCHGGELAGCIDFIYRQILNVLLYRVLL